MSAPSVFADSHAHLSYVAERSGPEAVAAILADWSSAWDACLARGEVGAIIVDPGVEAEDAGPRARLLRSLSPTGELPPCVRLAAGIWPGQSALADPRRALEALEAAIADLRAGAGTGAAIPAAIGEAGLDYHHDEGPRESQRELFAAQLDLAARLGLPAIVHSREAAEDTLALVREACRRGTPVAMHCFGYGRAEARAFLDAGCYLSFAGNITYKTASSLREACAIVPADRLLLETDSPYMNPLPLRGRPSTPRDLARTVAAAAELRGQDLGSLARAVAANARRLFGPAAI